MPSKEPALETWSSRRGFLLASIGSAVGIGNIWRFSAVVGQNGGGAYLVPYLVAVFAFALPLMVLEFAAGRRYRGDLVSAFRQVAPRLEVLGWLIATVVFTILSYYLVITGWTLAYLVFSAGGDIAPFAEFTGGMTPVASFAVCVAVVGVVISFGVRSGIERLATFVMPVAFVILLGLAAYAVTLDGWGEGARFLVTPDFAVLRSPSLWSAAFGQAFFSLSVGFGILLTYGRYLSRETDIVTSSALITVADLAVALLAGLVIFPIVFTYGLEPAMGAELAFSTLPAAFEVMPGGWLLAPAFFLLLFLAALTSAVSMLEVSVAAVMESSPLSRRAATAVLMGLVFLLGLPSALSYSSVDLTLFGWRVLDLVDETVGTMGLPVTALIIALVFARGRLEWLREELAIAAGRRSLRDLVLPVVRWVIPAVLALITLSRVGLALDPPGWHLLPAVRDLGTVARVLLTIPLTAALLASTLVVVRLLRRLRRARQRV